MRNKLVLFFQLIAFVIFLHACKSQKKLASSGSQKEKSTTQEEVLKQDTLTTVDSTKSIDSTSLVIDEEPADSLYLTEKPVEKEDTISIIGVGDIMLGTNFPEKKYLPYSNGTTLLKGVKDVLSSADLTFGNLEGVILDEGGEQKHCNNPDVCYLFRIPESMAINLKDAGFDVLSLANNHAGDFGNTGRKNTMKVLDSLGIHYGGLLLKPYTSFELDGKKYGFVAFSPNSGTQSIHDLEAAKQIVNHLDSINDIVIVSFHGGAEGKDHQHVTKETEYYYGENRGNVYQFAHLMVDAGADVIFGHGPHVTRAIEVYNKRFIAYSLGNFCTYARFNLRGPNGLAPIIKLYTKEDGEFLHGEITPIKQIGAGVPTIDDSKEVINVIRDLTKNDFLDSEIFIDDKGIIKYIQSEI